MTEHASLVRVTTFVPAEGRRDSLIEQLQQMASAFRGHDGLFGTQVCTVDEQPGAVAVVSRFRDRAALDSLIASNAGSGIEGLAALLARPPASSHFRSLG